MSLVLPLAAWPKADRELWNGLFAEGDPLDDEGPLVHLRQTSRQTLMLRYGRWLKWLSDCRSSLLDADPASRAGLHTLQDWLRALDHTAPMTQLMMIDGVLRILTAAVPDFDWASQRRLKGRLKRAAGTGDPERKRGRILSSIQLLDAAEMLADEARAWPEGALFRATGLRDAAMVAVLALLPMRRRSLAGLKLGESIFVLEDRITIALGGTLTKNGLPWEADVPPQSERFLRTYLSDARPTLAARGPGEVAGLWLDRSGKVMSEGYLGPRIAEATFRVIGIRVPPHFFRDAAATTLVRLSPQAARLIPSVLGHKGSGTAEKHYIHAQAIEAGREYSALIAAKRRHDQ